MIENIKQSKKQNAIWLKHKRENKKQFYLKLDSELLEERNNSLSSYQTIITP